MDKNTTIFRYVEGRGLLTKYKQLTAPEILEREGLMAVPHPKGAGWIIQPNSLEVSIRPRESASSLF